MIKIKQKIAIALLSVGGSILLSSFLNNKKEILTELNIKPAYATNVAARDSIGQTRVKGTVLLKIENAAYPSLETNPYNHLPLPGVNIVAFDEVDFPLTYTTTNYEGKYTIYIPKKTKKLRYSYIGLQTVEIPITHDWPTYTTNVTLIEEVHP